MGKKGEKDSFWKTLTGIITAIGAVLAAIATIVGIIVTVNTPPTDNGSILYDNGIIQQSEPMQIISFLSAHNSILEDESVQLEWDVANANEIAIFPLEYGALPINGSIWVTPKITTEYTLSASNNTDTITQKLTIYVTRKDQYQESTDHEFLCSSGSAWQSFKPNKREITGVSVFIQDMQNGIGTNGLILAIYPEPTVNQSNATYTIGDAITYSSPVYDIAESRGTWVYFDLSDVDLNLFNYYVIHLSSISLDDFYWYGNSNNLYNDGASNRCRDYKICNWDFAFKTYVND